MPQPGPLGHRSLRGQGPSWGPRSPSRGWAGRARRLLLALSAVQLFVRFAIGWAGHQLHQGR
eukprot:9101168-Alexandrium_andersonii.AAC.1